MAKRFVVRVGDVVKVLNPRLFRRVGYPMDVKEVAGELGRDPMVLSGVAGLMDRVVGSRPDAYDRLDIIGRKHLLERNPLVDDILKVLAVHKCRHEGWGGSRRQVYLTDPVDGLKGKHLRVIGKRVVRTGTYYAGTNGAFIEPDDYEASTLMHPKTVIILKVANDLDRDIPVGGFEIPLSHVTVPELWGFCLNGHYLARNLFNTVQPTDGSTWLEWRGMWPRGEAEQIKAEYRLECDLVCMQVGSPDGGGL